MKQESNGGAHTGELVKGKSLGEAREDGRDFSVRSVG